MSVELSQLEQAWLAAESIADEARLALKRSEELARRQVRAEEGKKEAEVVVLASNVEQLKAQQEEAERTASAAFDRFWSARNGSTSAGSAYA
jgi:hypothetical protein